MAAATPPPEALLISRRREMSIPRLSRARAALRAGMSEARWRQIEQGNIRIRGTDYPESGPPETIARMAQVVDVTPAELREAGRPDAAELLERMNAEPGDQFSRLVDAVLASRDLTEPQKHSLLGLLRS